VLNVSVRDGGLALVFSAGASGRSDDLSIVAARSIEMVRFEVFGGDGRLIDGRVTTEVPTTGVTESDVSSLTVFADVQMATIPSEPGAFARARVEARGGDVLILEAAIPQPRND
jgi:hypothetical protein